MKTITYFNFIVNILIIGYLMYKFNPFYIKINRTFWYKKIKSFTLMCVTSESDYTRESKGIFTFSIRNGKKLDEWDTDTFRSKQQKIIN